METEFAIGLLALLVAVYSMVSKRLSRWWISAPFAFLVIGSLLGGAGLDLFGDVTFASELLGTLAEVTLALVLFAAASTIRVKRLEHDSALVGRLLAIGLPLTIGLGTALALGLFPGISFGLALLIGTTLAPTDADLGHQVITDTSVPARIRRVLNVESGLNDGVAAPVVTIAIALALGDLGDMHPLLDAVAELLVAGVVGVVIGGVGRWALIRAVLFETASPASRQLATLALALAAYFVTDGLGASGFIAAFAAGLAFGLGLKERVESAVHFTEALSTLLTILVWLVFGLIVIGEHVLGLDDPIVIVYAILSLTLVRMVPVAIALVGTGLDRATVAFMGWFGPRGLASVVFVLLGLEALEANGVPSDPLGPIVGWTVALSVVLHGFSATPLAARMGNYAARLPADAPEHLGEEEPRRSAWKLHGHRPTRT